MSTQNDATQYTIRHPTIRNRVIDDPVDANKKLRIDGNGEIHGLDRVQAAELLQCGYEVAEGKERMLFAGAANRFAIELAALTRTGVQLHDAARNARGANETAEALERILDASGREHGVQLPNLDELRARYGGVSLPAPAPAKAIPNELTDDELAAELAAAERFVAPVEAEAVDLDAVRAKAAAQAEARVRAEMGAQMSREIAALRDSILDELRARIAPTPPPGPPPPPAPAPDKVLVPPGEGERPALTRGDIDAAKIRDVIAELTWPARVELARRLGAEIPAGAGKVKAADAFLEQQDNDALAAAYAQLPLE